MELRISKHEDVWVTEQRPIFSAIAGQVLALELDYNRANDDMNLIYLVD